MMATRPSKRISEIVLPFLVEDYRPARRVLTERTYVLEQRGALRPAQNQLAPLPGASRQRTRAPPAGRASGCSPAEDPGGSSPRSGSSVPQWLDGLCLPREGALSRPTR